MINIILCGGNGTRLWPISRKLYPKQFYRLNNNFSLFQETVLRNAEMCDKNFIIVNEEQFFLVKDQLDEIKVLNNKFILEPIGRNTAPAIAMACMNLKEDELVLVTPSDHFIKEANKYKEAIKQAKLFANDGYLVTFGLHPTYPETGFGYIEANNNDVISFKEKPDERTAKLYLEKGNYYWNSGIFLFKAGVFLQELKINSPLIYQNTKNANELAEKKDYIRINRKDMEKIPSDSVDYAVMEHSNKVKVVPSDIGWSDLGNFESLYEQFPKDEYGNSITDNYIQLESSNNLIISDNNRLITSIDIQDLIIVDSPDALLISKRGSSQKVKTIVKTLKEKKPSLINSHLTTYRPWGKSLILDESENYKIKRVEVKPGKKLTTQKHYHRNEHWIVLSGIAKVTIADEIILLRPNESSYIKMGEEHRLENPGKIDLVLIEVQVGEYLEQDDIVVEF